MNLYFYDVTCKSTIRYTQTLQSALQLMRVCINMPANRFSRNAAVERKNASRSIIIEENSGAR